MKNKNRILILSIYPAPYRVALFDKYRQHYDIDVFFENASGDFREKEWFVKGNYKVLDNAKTRREFKKINVKNYELVLAFDYASSLSVGLIHKCKRHRVPYIINCDGVMMTKHGNFVKDIIKKYLISGATLCFASGENAKQYFLKYGAKEANIIIHTFSTLNSNDILKDIISNSQKQELRKQLGLPTNARILIAVGRFIPLKRYNELIAEWVNMPKDNYLLLIGGGEEEDNYKKTIKNLGIENVLLKQFYPKDELMKFYQASDIFVHPTSYDVWGLVINESMACGLPVITTDKCVAGLELIKNGENGYIVSVGDDKALCEKAQEILSNDSLREKMSKQALETIKPYTIENMAKIHIDAMQKVLGND